MPAMSNTLVWRIGDEFGCAWSVLELLVNTHKLGWEDNRKKSSIEVSSIFEMFDGKTLILF